jgi:iron complex outermembrane receptor protein
MDRTTPDRFTPVKTSILEPTMRADPLLATQEAGAAWTALRWDPLPACAALALAVSTHASVRAQERNVTLESVTVVGTREVPPLLREVESASRLGLKIREIPATVEAPSRHELRDRGVRSVSEASQAVTGVTAGDFPAEPSNFSMRGFANSQINTLYNGIKIGPPNMTSRVMDVGNLERIEFLKGPASLMSGEGASGGAINLVTRRPHRGPVETEVDVSAGSFGASRLILGSGGTTAIDTLDYRFDFSRAAGDGFVADTGFRKLHVSGGLDWYLRPGLKLFGAVEYKKDTASPYWGTPLVSAGAPGIQPQRGVVSGTYESGFNGSRLGDVTLDQRTLRTNYNVLDARNTAEETWLRAGADWQIASDWTLRTQFYRYSASREWRNNEVTAFNTTTGLVDRERFFVAHDQTVVGSRNEAQWDGLLAGMRNRLVLGLDWSQLTFMRPGAANFPGDSVDLVDPQRGTYGLLTTQLQTSDIRNVALSIEDRLSLTPAFALVGGLRHESIELDRTSANAAGVQRAGFPFSKTWNPTTGRVGATWAPAPDLTFYGQYATAADVAANNIFLLGARQPLELTRTRTLETGVKQGFWANRGEWTLALYDIVRDNVYSAQGGRALALAGTQASRGVELSAAVRPVGSWRLWGNVAFNRTRYENYDFDGGSFSGNTPPNAPRVVANAGASYRWAGPMPIEVSAWLRHVGERFHSDANTVKLAAYTVADAALSINLQEKTRVTFRIRNLTNRIYAIWSDPFYPDQILLGAPRSAEIALRTRF